MPVVTSSFAFRSLLGVEPAVLGSILRGVSIFTRHRLSSSSIMSGSEDHHNHDGDGGDEDDRQPQPVVVDVNREVEFLGYNELKL